MINEEEIDNYKIITDKRYTNKNNYVGAKNIYDIKKPLKKNIISNWKSIRKGNKKIDQISEEEFSLYVPNTNIEEVRIMLSHRSCKSFSYLEEGFTSYCEFGSIHNKTGKLRKVKNWISYMGKIEEGRIFKKGYKKAYGISDYSFPNWERKEKLNVELEAEKARRVLEGDSCILALDSMRTLNESKEKAYVSSLLRTINLLKNNYKKIYFKIHPDSYEFDNDKFFRLLIENSLCEVEELDQDCSVERLSLKYNSDVIVNLSSVGLYCLLYSDCNVYTFYPTFKRHAKALGVEEENILGFEKFVPDVFWNNVMSVQGDLND